MGKVAPHELMRLLGYPKGKEPSGRVATLATEARGWYAQNACSWAGYRYYDVEKIGLETTRFTCGKALTSKTLSRRLHQAKAHAVAVVGVSAGPEVQAEVTRLWQDNCPDQAFVLDAYASAVAEQLVVESRAELCEGAEPDGMSVLPNLSPGCEGWDLRDQFVLLEMLCSGHHGRPLELLPSGMLIPQKSMLTVFGLTRETHLLNDFSELQPCSTCSHAPCAFRRSPMRKDWLSSCSPP